MLLGDPLVEPNSAWTFPSPLEPAWNKTCIDCAHPYARPAREWAVCTQSGSKYRNTCTAGRSGVQTCTLDTDQPVRTLAAAVCRIGRNWKPCACQASEV